MLLSNGGISINSKIFLSVLISSMIVFAGFTTLYIEQEENAFSDKESNKKLDIYIQSASDYKGYYQQEMYQYFEPGTYHVKISPVGKNITLILKSSYETIEKQINNTCRFNMNIGSTVWLAVMVDNPPNVDYSSGDENSNRLNIYFEKKSKTIHKSTIMLWGIVTLGGVLYAVRFYRRERE